MRLPKPFSLTVRMRHGGDAELFVEGFETVGLRFSGQWRLRRRLVVGVTFEFEGHVGLGAVWISCDGGLDLVQHAGFAGGFGTRVRLLRTWGTRVCLRFVVDFRGEFEALFVACGLGRGDGGADDVVGSLRRVMPLLPPALRPMGRRPPDFSGSYFSSEADGHCRLAGGEKDDVIAGGDADGDEFVVLVNVDGDDAAGHDVGEVDERGLLDDTVAGGEEDVLALFLEVADGEVADDFFAGLEGEHGGHVLALAGGADVGDFVDLHPEDAAGVGEEEQVGCGCYR